MIRTQIRLEEFQSFTRIFRASLSLISAAASTWVDGEGAVPCTWVDGEGAVPCTWVDGEGLFFVLDTKPFDHLTCLVACCALHNVCTFVMHTYANTHIHTHTHTHTHMHTIRDGSIPTLEDTLDEGLRSIHESAVKLVGQQVIMI